MGRHGAEERVHQRHVHHRHLVDDEQVAREGFDSCRLNPPVFGSTSSRRWIVFASTPVVSDSRFAARPVGAHSPSRTRARPRPPGSRSAVSSCRRRARP